VAARRLVLGSMVGARQTDATLLDLLCATPRRLSVGRAHGTNLEVGRHCLGHQNNRVAARDVICSYYFDWTKRLRWSTSSGNHRLQKREYIEDACGLSAHFGSHQVGSYFFQKAEQRVTKKPHIETTTLVSLTAFGERYVQCSARLRWPRKCYSGQDIRLCCRCKPPASQRTETKGRFRPG